MSVLGLTGPRLRGNMCVGVHVWNSPYVRECDLSPPRSGDHGNPENKGKMTGRAGLMEARCPGADTRDQCPLLGQLIGDLPSAARQALKTLRLVGGHSGPTVSRDLSLP